MATETNPRIGLPSVALVAFWSPKRQMTKSKHSYMDEFTVIG